MMMITRPEHDPTTKYISCWSTIVLEAAKKAKIECVDLWRKKANRKDFEGRMRKLEPSLVVIQGHGNAQTITGHDNEPLVTAGENESVLAGKITYAVSCEAAKDLGERIAKNPDTTFIGYNDKFVFTQQNEKWHRPIDDDRAKPFMETSNQVPLTLIKGHDCHNAYERSQEVGKTHFRRLMTSVADPDALLDAQCLWWNLKHQVCLGDGFKKMI